MLRRRWGTASVRQYLQQLIAAEPPRQYRASLTVNAVELEDILRQIDT